MHLDMCIDMHVDMHVDMRIDMCVDTYIYMCTGMHDRHVSAHALTCARARV